MPSDPPSPAVVTVAKITRSDCAGGYYAKKDELIGFLESECVDIFDDPPGSTITIRIEQIEEEKLNAMPEFEGW